MRNTLRKLGHLATIGTLGFGLEANAALILSTGVTNSFAPVTGSTGTGGNDLPNKPGTLLFGQLYADQVGIVDFFYVGTEAGYTNTLHYGSSSFSSTPGHNFTAPDQLIGSIGVGAGQFVDFGFCTSGGALVAAYDRCAHNDDAGSLIAQYNYKENPDDEAGYRSIAFRALTSYSASSGLAGASSYAPETTTDSALWAIFWDDSGAKNDDNHDDFIAVARYRTTAVPEPPAILLLCTGVLALAARRRRAEA
jgi:hypothetical protein